MSVSAKRRAFVTPPTSPSKRPPSVASSLSEREALPPPAAVVASTAVEPSHAEVESKQYAEERKPLGPEPIYKWYDALSSALFYIVSYAYSFLFVRFFTFYATLCVFAPWYCLYHIAEWPTRIGALLGFGCGGPTDAREKEGEVEFQPGSFARTPENHFKDLPEYNFDPNYFTFKGLRVHYVDLGPKEGARETLVFLHGNPTWSFMFRKVMWQLSENFRVLAVDMIGFGKSDKLLFEPHSISLQVQMFAFFVRHLNLKDITLVLHDWGGQIGLSALDEINTEGFLKNLVLIDTFLLGRVDLHHEIDLAASLLLATFQMCTSMLGRHTPLYPIIRFIAPHTPTSIVKGYRAPYPDSATRAVMETFPRLIHPYLPIHLTPLLATLFPELNESMKSDDDIHRRNMAIRKRLKTFGHPVLIVYGKTDQISSYFRLKWRHLLPGDALKRTGGRIVIVTDAGHLVPEDDANTLSDVMHDWLEGKEIEYSDKVHFL
ncbi:hypothetical protein SeMB42_g06002 [Synchytrium endobioticum]|uniref:AB hydrolase-1 domain-containing protein n=1 Tax=Synchytrium endobioticum TaxID=286115 RepID=A0A507CH00_9FUNG|nr:hypothetical protein SeLEV6574_g07297 [Synchytrium endobioticum]TPX40447.1 hypothetical protein SeMB42_g06002 [Synchytrium endobioticum]